MADDRVGTYWAGTVRVCGAERWVDYASPHSRHPRWRRLPHRGAQHADLLAEDDDALDTLARQLSSAHERLRQLAARLARGRLPDFGHLHAVTHLFDQLRARYFAPDVQGARGALRCAEPALREALRAVEGVYLALSGARVAAHRLDSRGWKVRARWLRKHPDVVAVVAGSVRGWVAALGKSLEMDATVEPRTLLFG